MLDGGRPSRRPGSRAGAILDRRPLQRHRHLRRLLLYRCAGDAEPRTKSAGRGAAACSYYVKARAENMIPDCRWGTAPRRALRGGPDRLHHRTRACGPLATRGLGLFHRLAAHDLRLRGAASRRPRPAAPARAVPGRLGRFSWRRPRVGQYDLVTGAHRVHRIRPAGWPALAPPGRTPTRCGSGWAVDRRAAANTAQQSRRMEMRHASARDPHAAFFFVIRPGPNHQPRATQPGRPHADHRPRAGVRRRATRALESTDWKPARSMKVPRADGDPHGCALLGQVPDRRR
jgi:hypothetical protein